MIDQMLQFVLASFVTWSILCIENGGGSSGGSSGGRGVSERKWRIVYDQKLIQILAE